MRGGSAEVKLSRAGVARPEIFVARGSAAPARKEFRKRGVKRFSAEVARRKILLHRGTETGSYE